ncbi:hypothetical protein [Paenibacillus sp. Soil522]|uniref:hypothetical protein n=1 Tax=Paenibacillus sp. Soil522 TaxID=1736388 RepID=UPI0006FAB546|nr:hypothetical protein [Paenibacillus sp. Soil522]KRE45475.1 hypothetical protein ASG81_12730 [Paenibacillus sp. Soil522]
MTAKAIQKIQAEMDAHTNHPYVQVIGKFLLQNLPDHIDLAEKIMEEKKSIASSLDAMRKVAVKKRVGDVAVLTDEEGFEAVLAYFKNPLPIVQAAPVRTSQPSPAVPPKRVAAEPIKKSNKKADSGQLTLDLFLGGM